MENNKYDEKYFSDLVREANGLGVDADEELKEQEEILKEASEESLRSLYNATPDEFYNKLMIALGSARINKLYNEKFQDKVNKYTEKLYARLTKAPKIVVWSIKAINVVCAKLLGLLKFAFDGALIVVGFATRVTGRVLSASAKIIAEEGIQAGKALSKSFKKNVLNK